MLDVRPQTTTSDPKQQHNGSYNATQTIKSKPRRAQVYTDKRHLHGTPKRHRSRGRHRSNRRRPRCRMPPAAPKEARAVAGCPSCCQASALGVGCWPFVGLLESFKPGRYTWVRKWARDLGVLSAIQVDTCEPNQDRAASYKRSLPSARL